MTETETGTEAEARIQPAIPKILDEPQIFEAWLEYSPQGWMVKGSLKELASDTVLIQPMCATDGETFHDCGRELDLQLLTLGDGRLELQNKRCLYDNEEPLKSYLAKKLNRFYIKLRVVRSCGIVYETQAAVIDRGEPQPLPEKLRVTARFADGMFVREGRPPNIRYYGRYQLTVSEDAGKEEIYALLPDTLPVEVHLLEELDDIGNDTLECRVQWKPFDLPPLTAGESVTVTDAAESLVIPAGTVLHTQTGIYRMDEPADMAGQNISDEVRLVFNVVAKDAPLTGVLSEENHGLEMAFCLKPTGAKSIRAFTCTEDGEEWTELPGLSLTNIVDAWPLTAGSGYAVVLGKDQEPYRSYRKAQEAGEEPEPFFVGFKVEGGVYDGKQLVLAWPDTYDLPPHLPQMGGSGGNQGNAGSDDRGDGTEGGQRPVLPKNASIPEFCEASEGKMADNPVSDSSGNAADEQTVLGIPQETAENMSSAAKTAGKDEPDENGISENMVYANGDVKLQGRSGNPAAKNTAAEFESEGEAREGMPDGAPGRLTAAVTISSGNAQERVRTPLRKESVRAGKSTGNRALFFVTAGAAAVLTGVGMAAVRSVAIRKISRALRRIFGRK